MSTENKNIQLFLSIMSYDNTERNNAEAKLNELKSCNFNELLTIFLEGMNSTNPKVLIP